MEHIAFSVIGFAFLLLARQSLYKYNSVLARSSFLFYFRFFRYRNNLVHKAICHYNAHRQIEHQHGGVFP